MYVDDLVITGSSPSAIEFIKRNLKSEFEMTDLGALSYFLEFEFMYSKSGTFMHQNKSQ